MELFQIPTKGFVLGSVVLLLSGCAATFGVPSDEILLQEKSEIETVLNGWLNKSVEELLDYRSDVFDTLDLGGGNVRYTFYSKLCGYVAFLKCVPLTSNLGGEEAAWNAESKRLIGQPTRAGFLLPEGFSQAEGVLAAIFRLVLYSNRVCTAHHVVDGVRK